MKTENPENVPLKRVLSEWKTSTPLPPRFSEGVWRRIEAVERPQAAEFTTLWELYWTWFMSQMARPAVVAAYVAVLLIAGLIGGQMHASLKAAEWKADAAGQYLSSVDPLHQTEDP